LSTEGVKIDVQRFLRVFLEEAADHLGTLETGLLRLEAAPDDRAVIDDVFRAAHSLKGGSSTFGLQQVGRLTHAMESRLEEVRTGASGITPELTSLLLRATDELRVLLAAAEEGRALDTSAAQVMTELERALGAASQHADGPATPSSRASAPTGAVDYQITFRPNPDIYLQGSDPLLVLRELAELGEVLEVRADLGKLPPLAALAPDQSYLAWSLKLRSSHPPAELREAFAFVEDGSHIDITVAPGATRPAQSATPRAEGEPAEGGRSAKLEPSTIRVDVEKVDKLINLVGELVIAHSMINQVVKDFTPEKLTRLQESVSEMERNVRELQERVMTVRMVPVSTVFSRVPRLVRDLAASLGKKVAVDITGGDTEIDKSVIERIGDPLTHLVRNAVDHGIESPAERQAADKPEQGRLKLSAAHQGGNVVINIEDDGKGLDTERIRKKGVSLGLIGEDEALDTAAIHELIFRAGFSTAASVTDVSGRGVGMDVVRTNIEALNGSVTLESVKGRGTRFSISLPLTLAIIDGLLVGVGSEVYVVPLISIIESFRPKAGDIKTLVGRGEVVSVRGKVLPLLRLRRVLAVPSRAEAPETPPLIVIIENQGATVGLLVDDIQGQAQVVIKSLETNFHRIDGVMGATIMGDRRVALILDVQGLTRLAFRPRPSGNERRAES
jgi:two-component system chemotaxis sensor kinase CheA